MWASCPSTSGATSVFPASSPARASYHGAASWFVSHPFKHAYALGIEQRREGREDQTLPPACSLNLTLLTSNP